jgi:hypothetical protein
MSAGANKSSNDPPGAYDDNESFLFPTPPTMKRRPNPLRSSMGVLATAYQEGGDGEAKEPKDTPKEKGQEDMTRSPSERNLVRSRSYLVRGESRRVLSEGKGGVAKKALDDAEQSERAVEIIFEELMNQMNIKDDMKVQMRAWDVEKKKTLLLQKRILHTTQTKDTSKEDTSRLFFDGCMLKVTLMGLKDFPRDVAKVVATVTVKEEKVKTPTPWKVPFECEILCKDLSSSIKIQLHNHTKFGLKEEFLGEVNVSLESIADDRTHVRWYELQPRQNKKDKVEGHLHVSLHLKVDKSKLLDRLEIERQYDQILLSKGQQVPQKRPPLAEQWDYVQNFGVAKNKAKSKETELENKIRDFIEHLRANLELEDSFIDQFKDYVNNEDVLWVDKLVSLGGLDWTLDHINFLCHKFRSKRKNEKDKPKVEKLVSIVRKMMVSRTVLMRLINNSSGLIVLLASLEHVGVQKGINVFQMLIACQECKQFSGDLGDAFEYMLNSNKKLFWSLLQELENGSDLKFKEVFLTFINITIVNIKNITKRINLRTQIITTGLAEEFLENITKSFPLPEIVYQVEEFLSEMDQDRNEVLLTQNIDKQDFATASGLFKDTWVRVEAEKASTHYVDVLFQLYKIGNAFEADQTKQIFDVITDFSSRPERLQNAGKGLLDDTAFLGDIRLEKMKEELKSAKLQIEQEMATRKQVELKMESMKLAAATGGGQGKTVVTNDELEEKTKGPDLLEGSEFKDLIRSILEPKKFDTVTPISGGPPPPPPVPGGPPPPPPPPPSKTSGGPPPPPPAPGGPPGPPPPPPMKSKGLKGAAGKNAPDEPKIVPLRIKKLNIVGKSIFKDSIFQNSVSTVDLGTLDSLFSVVKKRQPTKEELEEAEKKKKEAMRNAPKVVEPGRCQGIEILLRKCPVSAEEICETILSGKPNDEVSSELLAQIGGLFNEKNEDAKLKLAAERDALAKYSGADGDLTAAEEFLKTLHVVPRIKTKIDMILFRIEFDDMRTALEKFKEDVQRAFKNLRSEQFVKFLQMILNVSNYMNRFNAAAKDAKGFPLSNLLLLKDLKSTVDRTVTLLTTVVELMENKEPTILDIGKLAPNFESAATGALNIMLHIPSLIVKLMPLEKEVKSCTERNEAPFKFSMQELIKEIAVYLKKVSELVKEIEIEIEFFGDNEFLGSPPYANVESFTRSWDQIRLEHPGKATRARRNAECYAFFINIAQFLTALQKTRVFIEGKKQKSQKAKQKNEKFTKKAQEKPLGSSNELGSSSEVPKPNWKRSSTKPSREDVVGRMYRQSFMDLRDRRERVNFLR